MHLESSRRILGAAVRRDAEQGIGLGDGDRLAAASQARVVSSIRLEEIRAGDRRSYANAVRNISTTS